MFVQYSFVQPRRQQALADTHAPFEMSPSLVVATGLCSMIVTAAAFLLA